MKLGSQQAEAYAEREEYIFFSQIYSIDMAPTINKGDLPFVPNRACARF